ncbi:disintegrin and metalloproteinase domain-containing protein 12 [Uranotaenia lowii]|uniref:disintegrin and metalloproteinase domain-containing protein 12 n=1 Tax=Uranotaenia lowii TaxID=190385 RepID=UPI002478947D|nr:disintegrin and metalloproteinase domain-containing protein 12 [Uranotaenia lowii]
MGLEQSSRENGLHATHLTLAYRLAQQDVILDLQLDERLLPRGHFLSYQLKGSNGTNKVVERYDSPNQVELCHYRGTIRDIEESSVALSTCNGIRGVIFDGRETYYIENDGTRHGVKDVEAVDHYIYRHSDLLTKPKCGYEGGINTTHDPLLHQESEFNRLSRHKRATKSSSPIRGPYNANKHSSYVELVIVIDNKMFKSMKENFKAVQQYCKDITNIINALYEPLNIFIGLVGVVIWNEANEIELSSDGEITLKNFLHYRKKTLSKDHPNDNAQLFTKEHFDGGVVGKALKGPICTYEFSGGVEMYHSEIIGVQATTVAHEMGHNFGMEHDTPDCKCPEDRCIMSASSSSTAPRHWSSCSIDQLNLAFHHGMNYCLKNKPTQLFDSPVCGNGFVEPGEQCDCGLPDFCDNSCCNPRTCMLHSNASCATGECCDLITCKPKIGGTVCREAEGECDLPEYCSGESEYCPNDVFKRDTEVCDDGKAFCYKGSCRSQNDQCRLLWGPTGKSSDQCYKKNEEGSRHGNCGYNRIKNEYVKCDDGDVFCGMLHCRHLNERLEFGMESVAILSHSFITFNGSVIPCRSAIVDLGLQKVDPGLAPDGAKCGEGKMCLNQVCMAVESLRAKGSGVECPENCNGNGICNSEGHCHCNKGFAPPLCNSPGNGGSEDSGPASDPNAGSGFTRFLYIFFLGVIPFCSSVAFIVYYIKQHHGLTKRKPPNVMNNMNDMKTDSSRSTGSTHTMVPSSPNSPDDMNSALLRPSTESSDIISNNNMFGKFKGFTLQPLPKHGASLKSPNVAFVHPISKYSEDTSSTVPSRPAPPAPKLKPAVPPHGTQIGNNTNNKPAGIHQINGYKLANHEHQMENAPALPPLNPGSTARPIISSPILESSTCTSREISSPLKHQNTGNGTVPIRPAPVLPIHAISAGSDDSMTPEILINPTSKDKKQREGKLNRITSYLKKDEKPPKPEPKNIKIADKEKLKNLEISAPIPIASDLAKSMPKLNETNTIGRTATSVQRAKSMRDPEMAEKRSPGDGQASESPRKPTTLKRPQSMVGSRPTMPPPRPPIPIAPSIVALKHSEGYHSPPPPKSVRIVTPDDLTYDDCIDTDSQPNSIDTIGSMLQDNIYSVIDESPSPPSILSPPTTLSSESSDSMGLLGEIVNEIQSRGSDSVYIASTLKKEGGLQSGRAPHAEEEEDEPTYVNTSEILDDDDLAGATGDEEEPYPSALKSSLSSASSGYVRPSTINTPIARVAPTKPESVSTNLSSFKNGGDPLSTLKFEGPVESKAKPAAASYKPYHSTVTNTRPGSVVAATKAKISQEKLTNGGEKPPASKLTRNPTPPNLTTTAGKKPLNTTVRTRSPSPKGRITPNGTVPGSGTKAATAPKPKTAAKPESAIKPKVSSNSKILTAAARPTPGRVSNVASLQQKFEAKK